MKRFLTFVTALVMVITIAGCSSGTVSQSSSADSNTTTQAPKEVKLSLGLPGGYDITNKKIVDGFQAKYPYVKLEIDEAPWSDFISKITTEIAGNNAPDTWLQENAVILGYGKQGAAEDLAPYIAKDLKKDDYISGLFAAKVGDKVWGVPHGVNPIALAYNKKIFTDANVPLPTDNWTYQDLIDTAKKLTKDTNGDGTPEIYGFIVSSSITNGWFPWIKSAGGQALDSTLTNAVFDDAKSIEGITAWSDLINKLKVSPSRSRITGLGGEFKMFGNNMVAMDFLQYSSAQALINKDFPNLDYDVVKIPKGFDGKRIVPMVSNDWLIFSRAKKESKDAAWLWLKYYLSQESQDILAESGASLPLYKSSLDKVQSSSFKPANKKAFTEGIAEAGTSLDENACWNEWRTAAQPIFNDIYDNKISPTEGLKQIKAKVQKVLDDNK